MTIKDEYHDAAARAIREIDRAREDYLELESQQLYRRDRMDISDAGIRARNARMDSLQARIQGCADDALLYLSLAPSGTREEIYDRLRESTRGFVILDAAPRPGG